MTDIGAALDAMRQESKVWHDQSATLQTLSAKVVGLNLGAVESGMFIMMRDAYNAVVTVMSERSAEGAARMVAIGDALTEIAKIYESEEQSLVHKNTDLW